MGPQVGLEPTTSRLTADRLYHWATGEGQVDSLFVMHLAERVSGSPFRNQRVNCSNDQGQRRHVRRAGRVGGAVLPQADARSEVGDAVPLAGVVVQVDLLVGVTLQVEDLSLAVAGQRGVALDWLPEDEG